MKESHATDREIQEYLDQNSTHQDPEVARHIETCEACQQTLRMYRMTVQPLETDPGYHLPKNFARSAASEM